MLPHFTDGKQMFNASGKMRDTPEGLQPGLVTPEGTLVFPGVSLTEPPGRKDHLGPFLAL